MAIVKARPDASVNQHPPVSNVKSVQRGVFSLTSGSGTAIISAVNPLKSKLNFSVKNSEVGSAVSGNYYNGATALAFGVGGIITGPNSIEFSSRTELYMGFADGAARQIFGGNATIYWEVEESV